MDNRELKTRFSQAVLPDILNDWEIEEIAEPLQALPDAALNEIFRQITVIWPVSHALCNNFLQAVAKGLTCLHHSQLADWVKAILAAYEAGGLHEARQLLEQVEETFLCPIRGEAGISFAEITGRLQPYATGLAGHPLELVSGQEIYTDTAAIHLPAKIAILPKRTDNFLLYKLIISFQWAFTAIGTFSLHIPDNSPTITLATKQYHTLLPPACTGLDDFFNLFQAPPVAAQLFHLGETARATAFLWARLPGLMRESSPIFQALAQTITPGTRDSTVADLQRAILLRAAQDFDDASPTATSIAGLFNALFKTDTTSQDSAFFAATTYDRLLDQAEEPYSPLIFQGVLRPAEVLAVQRKKRATSKEKFIEALAAFINAQHPPDASRAKEQNKAQDAGFPELAGQTAALIAPARTGKEPLEAEKPQAETLEFITIDDSRIDLPDKLKKLAREITEDLGQIPAQYISSARQAAGKGLAQGNAPPPQEGEALLGFIYDEWDYRRAGFRKNWCSLTVRKIIPVTGAFVGNTLAKYRGHLIRLKRQFEMMRNQERFIRRQKDGDEIDLDALIETLADIKAGLSPSEELFIRLARDQRSIGAFFLVDMSSSTEGWVNTAIKEALLLMCEALEVLGDTYGIYGFSGMRRTRSELFQIKGLAEHYSDEVKGRIAAIAPQEYTRMGPPIRHLTRLLAESDARIRLLITLSDGKPEDYDDYKGDYAIEDTRHALIEAKAQGVHPFCITIDKQAHAYLPHMYGEVNYICIDEVGKLPNRIPEIYRGLTT